MNRLAVDVSLLRPNVGGLTRYLSELLPRLMNRGGASCEWRLYGRKALDTKRWDETQATISQRSDYFPAGPGRLASLFTSSPVWTGLDRPDVFWGPGHRLPLWLPKGTRAVVTVHDVCWLVAPDTMRISTRLFDRMLMPMALKRADAVIAVSEATRNALLAYFPEVSGKLHLIHEGASALPEPMTSENLNQWGVTAPYVLFVGTLEPRKNLLRLLEAFARLQKNLPSAETKPPQLVVVGGSGWGDDNLRSAIQRLGQTDFVRILGRVSDTQLSTLYRHAVCLAMPSLYEGFGLPLVEAMAQGTPLLTSLTSAMPEVAGRAGCLVNPLDIGSIEKGLSNMLYDQTYRDGLAAYAKIQASKFTWDRAAMETLRVLVSQ